MKRSLRSILLFFAASLLIAPAITGCAKRQVTRIDPGTQVDLSGMWNDTDSQMVAKAMVTDCLGSRWLGQFRLDYKGRKPVVIAGSIRNKSLEHIPTGAFLREIEKALLNTGEVGVVASAEERGEVRGERADQQVNASPETLKRMGREKGADMMLLGEINQINDQEKGKDLKYYQINLTMVNIETNEKTWIGEHKIKKMVQKGKFKP
jgi:penicillin-binding protein activator